MLRELAERIAEYNESDAAVREQHDWVDRLSVTPGDVKSDYYGALIWHTNHTVACAATRQGLGRLLTLALQTPYPNDVIAHLSTRPIVGKGYSRFRSGGYIDSVYFDRETLGPLSRMDTFYLRDLVRLLPNEPEGPEYSPLHILGLISGDSVDFPVYS